jgi:hypothetical protein
MIERSVSENILVLFILLPCMLITFWWFLRLINWSMKVDLKYVMLRIYTDPIAAAIYRSAVFLTVGQLVIAAFQRWV